MGGGGAEAPPRQPHLAVAREEPMVDLESEGEEQSSENLGMVASMDVGGGILQTPRVEAGRVRSGERLPQPVLCQAHLSGEEGHSPQ